MLSGKSITYHMVQGNIVIEPFIESHLQPNSYDITLGIWCVRFKKNDSILNLENFNPYELYQIENNDDELIVSAGERILCNTHEFFGTRRKVVPCISTRSTIARLGLDICGSAGFGDLGYINRWTLELQNNSPYTVSIPIYTRIGQVWFQEIDKDGESYKGSYNLDTRSYNFDDMLFRWDPTSMIPNKI